MPQPETVSHVDATFGGRQIRFELYRDAQTVDRLEEAIGSLSACWGRFRDGDWTLRDVRTIIALAHPIPRADAPRGIRSVTSIRDSIASLTGRKDSSPPTPVRPPRGVPIQMIDAVISSRPLATYAALAMLIVTGAFAGLPADGAKFDDGQPRPDDVNARESADLAS